MSSTRTPARRKSGGGGLVVEFSRRSLIVGGITVFIFLGLVTGALPRLFGGPSGNTVAATGAPGATVDAPIAYLDKAPSLDGATSTDTRNATVSVSGAVPAELAGHTGYKVRVYVARGDGEPVRLKDATVGASSLFVIKNIKLQQGRNTFTATIVGPDGESRTSTPVIWVLDTTKPKLTITDPVAGAVVNGGTVDIAGRTQAGSTVSVRNPASKGTATTKADAKGAFTITIGLVEGENALQLTATDPAGNAASTTLPVTGGNGRLTVELTASSTHLSRRGLPTTLVLTALARDPDGNPLPGAEVAFTLTIAGLPPFTNTGKVTDASGTATFETTIPAGTTAGRGTATVTISTGPYGDDSMQIAITVGP